MYSSLTEIDFVRKTGSFYVLSSTHTNAKEVGSSIWLFDVLDMLITFPVETFYCLVVLLFCFQTFKEQQKKSNIWHKTYKKTNLEKYFRTVVAELEIYVDLSYITTHLFLVVCSSLRTLIVYVVLFVTFFLENVHSRSSKCKLNKLSLHVKTNVIKLITKNIP